MTLLAWIPFLEPINWFHQWWYLLLIPLAFGIAVTYKAVRLPSLHRYWTQVMIMSVQIIVGVVALGVLVAVFVQFAIPTLTR
jgi:hypothetical protein